MAEGAEGIMPAGRHGPWTVVMETFNAREHQCVQLHPLPPRAVTPADLLDADIRAVAARDPRIGAIGVPGTVLGHDTEHGCLLLKERAVQALIYAAPEQAHGDGLAAFDLPHP